MEGQRECRSIPRLITILEGVYGRLGRIDEQVKKVAHLTFPVKVTPAAAEIKQSLEETRPKQQPPLMKAALELVSKIDNLTEVIEKQLGLAYQELTDVGKLSTSQ